MLLPKWLLHEVSLQVINTSITTCKWTFYDLMYWIFAAAHFAKKESTFFKYIIIINVESFSFYYYIPIFFGLFMVQLHSPLGITTHTRTHLNRKWWCLLTHLELKELKLKCWSTVCCCDQKCPQKAQKEIWKSPKNSIFHLENHQKNLKYVFNSLKVLLPQLASKSQAFHCHVLKLGKINIC